MDIYTKCVYVFTTIIYLYVYFRIHIPICSVKYIYYFGGEEVSILIFLQVFIIVCIFIIGALFGSFLSLATYRIPRHEDIVATRSYCPNCKHRLGFFDLIPVLSYIMRGAKCKYCKEKISPRYFFLETINGIIFVILYLFLGYTIKLAIVALVYVLIVLVIGSCIMKSKMTESEKKELEKRLKK